MRPLHKFMLLYNAHSSLHNMRGCMFHEVKWGTSSYRIQREVFLFAIQAFVLLTSPASSRIPS
jgi:hypothetical protein